VQRKLFTVHFHVYAAPAYIKRFGKPASIDDLDDHRIVVFGENAPTYLKQMNWLCSAGREPGNPRAAAFSVNNVVAIRRAVETGVGIAMLPDYLISPESELSTILNDYEVPSFDCFFVYPEELRDSARVTVFRDFLIANARRWSY
jgi:DNA-binding transcriptional LysR family regulator